MADEPRSVTTHDLLAMKERGERIVVLTCYDALFARLLDAAGVDLLLVGDSVNQVLAGAETTLSATLEQMIYHTKIVRRGAVRAMVVCDMPFLTYQVSAHEAIRNCGRVMQETDCHGVKLEGGATMAETVRALVDVDTRHGPPGSHPPVGARVGRLPRARTRRENRRATQGRCQGAGAGGRLCHRTGAHPCAARIPDHQVPHDPHHRHRRRASLRRPGAGAPRHAGVERPVQRQVREALCGARGGRARGRQAVCRRGTRGPVSRSRAFVSEVNDWTRRDVLAMLAAAAWTPFVPRRSSRVTAAVPHSGPPGFRVRTITAGTNLKSLADTRAVEAALATLKRAKQAVTDAGYEVQTVRIATQPLLEDAGPRARGAAMSALQALDRAVVAESALLSIGPVLAPDGDDPEFGAWAAELARTTQSISFTVRVASPERGTSPRGVTAAGDAMAAIARATPAGIGNFRFAAAANVPAGTPFFPVAYHSGSDAMAIGLESPPLLTAGLAEANTLGEAKQHLTEPLESRLG